MTKRPLFVFLCAATLLLLLGGVYWWSRPLRPRSAYLAIKLGMTEREVEQLVPRPTSPPLGFATEFAEFEGLVAGRQCQVFDTHEALTHAFVLEDRSLQERRVWHGLLDECDVWLNDGRVVGKLYVAYELRGPLNPIDLVREILR